MNLYQASFLLSVQKFPTHIALAITVSNVKESQTMTYTYQALFEISQQWGRVITAFNHKECPVAIYGGRQWQMYAGILAILSTNSAYVPLNNKQPVNRNHKVLSQLNNQVLLVAENEDPTELLKLTKQPLVVIYLGSDTPKWLTHSWHHQCVKINDNLTRPALIEKNNLRSIAPVRLVSKENHCAYILFTSGSTGIPKGIAVSNKNIINHLHRLDKVLQLKPTDKVSQFFELSFDLSIHDMFSCWGKGAALYVIPSEQLICPITFIKQHKLTVFSGVASVLSFMDKLCLLKPQQLPSLRISCFGGEKLLTNQAIKWQQCANNSRVINLYGPTECTITATYFELDNNQKIISGSVPIGKALSGLSTLLIKNNEEVTTTNTLAELYIAGDQLVEGYFQDEEKTAQAFITLHSPLVKIPTRYYRTGDTVYYDKENNIVFHGRNDQQFKVSGHRVEAAEIETTIVNFSDDITWCVISAQLEHTGNTSINAFIEYAQNSPISLSFNNNCHKLIKALRAHCLQKLPAYMLPDKFHFYQNLPRNVSGKVDISSLLEKKQF
jgi:amino acid adenylation domain-containing protein